MIIDRQREQRRRFVFRLIDHLESVGVQPDRIPGTHYEGYKVCVLSGNFSHAHEGDSVYIEGKEAKVINVPQNKPNLWRHLDDQDYPGALLELLEKGVESVVNGIQGH